MNRSIQVRGQAGGRGVQDGAVSAPWGNKQEWLLWNEAVQECTEGTAGAMWETHT